MKLNLENDRLQNMDAIKLGIITFFILTTPAFAGESQTEFSIIRNRPGVALGVQMVTGRLVFKSPTAGSTVAIKLMPSSRLSLDFGRLNHSASALTPLSVLGQHSMVFWDNRFLTICMSLA